MRRSSPILLILLLSTLSGIAQTNSVTLRTGPGVNVGSYSSITDAYAAIPATLATSYIIELTSAYTGSTEVYPISFVAKTGASSVNTITLRPAPGVSSVSISTTLSTTTNAVLILNDADYVIIDGRAGGTGTTKALKIENLATNSNTVQLINGACFDTVQYCILNNGSVGSAGRAIYLNTSASNTTGNSDNYFAFNDIAGSRYGANSNGTAANANTRNKFYACNFQNVIFTGIWSQVGTAKLIVDSCNFTCSSASATTPYGILFDSQTDSAIITRNNFNNLQASGTSAIRGIYVRSTTGTSYSMLANNFISLTAANNSSTSVIGIAYEGSNATKAEVYYNSVRIGGSLSSGGTSGNVVSAAFYNAHTGATNEFIIKNNIFVNDRSGGTSGVQHVASAINSTAGTFTMNYNTYNASSAQLVRYGSTIYTDMPTWQAANTAPNEVNSNSKAVNFISATDLHLTGASLGDLQLIAERISFVSVDIDNQNRSSSRPYRGADESLSNPLPVNLLTFTAAHQGKNVLLEWITSSETNNVGFDLERSLDGNNFSKIGFIAGAINSNVIKQYNYVDTYIPSASRVYYRLKLLDVGGSSHYSPISVINFNSISSLEIMAYPNPFIERLSVNLSSDRNDAATINLVDVLGRIIKRQDIHLIEGVTTITFEGLKALAPGNYYLKVNSTNKQLIKLVKL